MIIFLTQLFYWIAFFIFLLVLFLLFLWMWSSIIAKVPFISVPNSVLPEIEKNLNLKENSVVYDLGCGDGKVLFYLSKNNPNAKYIGIESAPFPLLFARINSWWFNKNNKGNIKIIKQNFFNTDLSNATHVFTYLYPNVMDDLLPKFDEELKVGTRLVSTSFHFTGKMEKEKINLNRGKYKTAKELYIYEF